MEGLVGFFHMGNAGSGYAWSAMALFDGDTAIQMSDRIQPGFDSYNNGRAQFGRGRTDDIVAAIHGNDHGDGLPWLVEFNRKTGATTFVKTTGLGFNADTAVCWDANSGTYYACTRGGGGGGNDALYSVNHITGVATQLSGTIAPYDWSLYDMVIVGDSVFVLHASSPGPELYRFNRASGAYQQDINLEPTYTFLGSQFPWIYESTNQQKNFTMMAFDRAQNRVYFGIQPPFSGLPKILGYVEAASESALETALVSGTFNIKLLPHAPTQVLHGLMWLPPYV
jgi:hypothetical protein